MTQEEINKGNKLIAEFMGWVTHPIHGDKYLINTNKDRKTPCWSDINNQGMVSEFTYHYSWDWLMPVVEKIISLGWHFELNGHGVANDFKFYNYSGGFIENTSWSTPLLATYNCVIDFIQWYNTQNAAHVQIQ